MIGFTVDLNVGWQFDIAALVAVGVPAVLTLLMLRTAAILDERRSRRTREVEVGVLRRLEREDAELSALLEEATYRAELRKLVSS